SRGSGRGRVDPRPRAARRVGAHAAQLPGDALRGPHAWTRAAVHGARLAPRVVRRGPRDQRAAVAGTWPGPARDFRDDAHRPVARPASTPAIPRARQPLRQRSAIMAPMRQSMRQLALLVLFACVALRGHGAAPPLTEERFRSTLG